MAQQDNNLAKKFIINVVRGGTKATPVVGAFLEQAIFGTLDQVEAAKESEKLNNVLKDIQDGIDSGSATLAEVLERVNQQAILNQKTSARVEEFIAAIRQGDEVVTTPVLDQAVKDMFLQHGHRLEDVEADFDASYSALAGARELIGIARTKPHDEPAPTGLDRVSFIGKLNDLDAASVGTLVVALEASGYVAPNLSPRERVTDLIEWADGVGPGIQEVYRVTRQLYPNFL